MAIIKRRIMSRSQIVTYLDHTANREKEPFDHPSMMQVHADFTAHLLADGKDVKVYHDVQMGGMVVEYNDGT